jgi:hypothetical protein
MAIKWPTHNHTPYLRNGDCVILRATLANGSEVTVVQSSDTVWLIDHTADARYWLNGLSLANGQLEQWEDGR